MKVITTTLVAGALLAAAGVANADPVALSATQMDGITAGATAIAGALALSSGDIISATGAVTQTVAMGNSLATASAQSGAIAASVYFLPAVAASGATATASLP